MSCLEGQGLAPLAGLEIRQGLWTQNPPPLALCRHMMPHSPGQGSLPPENDSFPPGLGRGDYLAVLIGFGGLTTLYFAPSHCPHLGLPHQAKPLVVLWGKPPWGLAATLLAWHMAFLSSRKSAATLFTFHLQNCTDLSPVLLPHPHGLYLFFFFGRAIQLAAS